MLRAFLSGIAVVLCAALCARQAAASEPGYRAVKAAIVDLQRGGYNDKLSRDLAPYGPRKFQTTCWARSGCVVLDGCSVLETYLPSQEANTRAANYALIADVSVTYEHVLTQLGYPQTVWGRTVNDFETYEIARAEHGRSAFFTETAQRRDKYKFLDEPFEGVLGQQLIFQLRTYQNAHPRLHGFVFTGGCGAAEVPVKIVTSPLATQLFIIPTFFYDVCRAQDIKPDDMSKCNHWREVLAPVESISGSYHYFVRWADGVARRGILDVNDLQFKGAVGIVTLRKP